MVNDVGKTVATIKLLDGTVVNFFNKTYSLKQDIYFYDENGSSRYAITRDNDSFTNKYRCGYYAHSYSQSANFSQPRLILNLSGITISGGGAVTANPLWQMISPSVNKLNVDEYQLSWWSNVDAKGSLKPIDANVYKYDIKQIRRFSYNELANLPENASACKILCTANIRWERLAQGTASGPTESHCHLTPIIVNPTIVTLIEEQGYITDFATGGGSGSGGIGMHAHTSMQDGGFAAAIFMPSANMRVLNWR